MEKIEIVDRLQKWKARAGRGVQSSLLPLRGFFRHHERQEIAIAHVRPIPISALEGDLLLEPSERMPWYDGPAVMRYLESVDTAEAPSTSAFRMPVQWVNRPRADFRGLSGRIASGVVHPGDAIRICPSGVESRVAAIVTFDGERPSAQAGDSVTLVLDDEVDISRGDMLAAARRPPEVADQFEAHLLWMGDAPMVPGRTYLLKTHAKETRVSVTTIKHRIDVTSGRHLAARSLGLNDIGVVTLSTSQALPYERYADNHTLGAFVLIDPMTFETVGAGMIEFALRRASNIHWQATEVSREARANLKAQHPCCVWFTGLSGSGKSTIAGRLELRLLREGRHTYLIDGDNVRHGLNRDLGFTEADHAENVRHVAEVAHLMVDAGLIVLVALISPFRSEREFARSLFGEGEFVEVFVDTPLEECERRDRKGLYAKARAGLLPNLTGIDSPYGPPDAPEVHLGPDGLDVDVGVEQILSRLP